MSSKDINIKAKNIKAVKDWSEPKSVCNIQVFLGFINFYQQFIQRFSRIVSLPSLILKTTMPPESLTSNRLEIGDGEGDVSINGDTIEFAEKSRKSKGQNLSKSQKLTKSKKPPKNKNSPKFDTKETKPSFLTHKARAAFNRLQLVFIKALIFWHFDLEYYI